VVLANGVESKVIVFYETLWSIPMISTWHVLTDAGINLTVAPVQPYLCNVLLCLSTFDSLTQPLQTASAYTLITFNHWRLPPSVRCKARRNLSEKSSRPGSTTWTICESLVNGKRISPMWVGPMIYIEISPPSTRIRGFLSPYGLLVGQVIWTQGPT